MSSTSLGFQPVIGFIGLGDQGLPMAAAIAQAGYELHVWTRRGNDPEELQSTHHVTDSSLPALARASDVVALCVSTDDDVLELAGQLVPFMRPGSILINHGTGTPANALRLVALAHDHEVQVLDAPVSGGRVGAESHALTALVGGPDAAFAEVEPILRAFSAHVIHLGPAGSGQMAKLINNALLMTNQAAIADVFELAQAAGIDAVQLFAALKLGSGSSTALTLINTMITPDTVDHLTSVGIIDMQIFDTAMRDAGVTAAAPVTARGVSGAERMAALVALLNPTR